MKKSVIVGPWGGNGGTSWDDETFTGVREIKLVYNRCIDSIVVVYDKQGHPFKAQKHGGSGGNNTATIKLEYPEEFLISVRGHYGPLEVCGGNPYIRSLTFKSNRQTFGPFGVEEGKKFNFSAYPTYEIVGFHGRSGWYLDSFGLHLSPEKPKDELALQGDSCLVGPRGGNGGNNWNDGIFTGVREITLVYGSCIDAITVVYDKQGVPFRAEKHGRGGGDKTAKITLQYPDEFLTNVSGHYGPINAQCTGDPYIRSLTFQSNRRTFGPYGVEKGRKFSFSAYPTHEIVGFHGRSGWYLDSIGLHLSPAKPKDAIKWPKTSFLVGPWGGNSGTNWDDGIFTGVREITLVYGSCIDAITVVYDKNGAPFNAEKHGRGGGDKTAKITLQYPGEFLTNVSGHYGPINAQCTGDPYIRSLTFQSNCRTFGPYGVEKGTPFTLATNGHRVLGLKGRSGWYLDAIAFHLSTAVM